MRALIVVVVVACGGGSSDCPKEVAGNSAEGKVIVERCRADGWSKAVTDCLKAAKTEEATEPCLDKLDKSQQAKLRKAFEPLYAQSEAAEQAVNAKLLTEDIAALRLDELVARDAACGAYKTAVTSAQAALGKCTDSASLETYALVKSAQRDVEALRALPDAQLGAACTDHAKTFVMPSCK